MTSPAQPPQLKRVLTLRDLVFYGIILITPIAPVPIYGVAQQLSRGHVFLCLLLAGVAMMLTAVSYGRMAAIYPSAGSAYVYVGRGLNSHLGFLAWALTLDYVVLPIVAIIQASLAVARLVPSVPYAVWASVFSLGIMLLNLRGIRATAGANTILLSGMSVIIAAFLILSGRYLFLHGGVNGFFSLAPIYNPGTFDAHAIATATSFAALTYIGFDGVTTLAEDAKDPKRNILLAILLVCAFTTLFSCLLVLSRPDCLAKLRNISQRRNGFPRRRTPCGRAHSLCRDGSCRVLVQPGRRHGSRGGRGTCAVGHGS